jgi:hypothetical protein
LTLVKPNLTKFISRLGLTLLGLNWPWSNLVQHEMRLDLIKLNLTRLILYLVWPTQALFDRDQTEPTFYLVWILLLGEIQLLGPFLFLFLFSSLLLLFISQLIYREENFTLFRLHFSSTLDVIREKKTQVQTKFF